MSLAYCIGLLSIIATALTVIALQRIEQRSLQLAFDLDSRQVSQAIQQQLAFYERNMRLAASLIDAEELFQAGSSSATTPARIADAFPDIHAIGYISAMPSAGASATLTGGRVPSPSTHHAFSYTRQDGNWIAYWHADQDVTQTASTRQSFLSSLRERVQAHVDQNKDGPHTIALLAVNDAPVSTATYLIMLLPLAKESSQHSAALGYSDPPDHWLFAVQSEHFFASALQQTDPGIIVRAYSGAIAQPEALLYDSSKHAASSQAGAQTSDMTSMVPIKLNGQPWTIVTSATPAYQAAHQQNTSAIAAAAGGLFSLLLFSLAWRARSPANGHSRPIPSQQENARIRQLETMVQAGQYEITADPQTKQLIHSWSPGMFTLLGLPESSQALSLEEYVAKLVHSEDQERVRNRFVQAVSANATSETDAVCVYRVIHPDGHILRLYDWLQVCQSQDKRVISGFRLDITEPSTRGKTGYASAIQFQALLDLLPGVPYLACLDRNPGVMHVSSKVESLLGFSAEEWTRNSDLRIRQLHPEDRARVLHTIAAARASNTAFHMEYRVYHRDGKLLWLHDEARIITDAQDKPLLLQGVVLDITERKQSQQALVRSHQHLQQMITDLDALRAQEHNRLAKEIHDDLGQLLAALKMDMTVLQSHLPKGDYRLAQLTTSINNLIDTMMTSLRRIIADLPPKDLDDNGLCKALQLLATSFSKRHQIVCRLDIQEKELALDATVGTPIYRLVQEALNNVAKHAQATCVGISLSYNSDTIELAITDNGKGIHASDLNKKGSFGLVGMRERVMALGGNLHIDSSPGAGCTLKFMIPAIAPALHSPYKKDQNFSGQYHR